MKWLLSLAWVFTPVLVFGAVGFTQDSVWLSHTPVIEGETVSIYAALTNGTQETLRGVAYFRDNGVSIGSLPITLKPGEARIISVPWSPKEGEHALAVEIASSTITLPKNTETTSVVVKERGYTPPAPQGAAAGVAFSDSSSIQARIETLSPAVKGFMQPLFETVDGWRLRGANFLGAHTDSARADVERISAEKKALAEEGTPEAETASRKLTVSYILHTILLYIYEALQTLIAKAGFFYPLVAVLFFLFLWKLVRRVRRPTYD